ncbi:hypothetical protein [Actinomadura sp. 9N407]|uniref:hypothetical protein n=1 Tax=Actinomadura sp. 9N407 TaxID=3375154 RepID=UPI00378F7874
MIEGRTPFARTSVMGTLSAVLTEEPARPQASGPLGPLILAMLIKDPAARLSTDQVESALRSFAAGEPTLPALPLPQGAPPGPLGQPTVPAVKPRKSHRAWGIAAALSGTVVLVAVMAIAIAIASQGSSGTASSDTTAAAKRQPSATAAATPPARFAAIPSPCGLITAEQASQLVPSFSTSNDATRRSKSCTWMTGPLAPGSHDDRLAVTLRIVPEAKAADQAFIQDRNNAVDPTDVPDLGDAAFAYDTDSDSKLVFRVDNLTAEINYQDDDSASPQKALKAARWVERSLEAGR